MFDTGLPQPFGPNTATVTKFKAVLNKLFEVEFGRNNIPKKMHLPRRLMAECLHAMGYASSHCDPGFFSPCQLYQ